MPRHLMLVIVPFFIVCEESMMDWRNGQLFVAVSECVGREIRKTLLAPYHFHADIIVYSSLFRIVCFLWLCYMDYGSIK